VKTQVAKAENIVLKETVFCLKVLLLGKRHDVRSARPDLHVFYSDGRSEKNLDSQCEESAGFLIPAF